MLPGRTYSPRDIAHIARRRKWLIATSTFIGALAGCMVYLSIPALYRSDALIAVLPPPDQDNGRSGDPVSLQSLLPSLTQRVLHRSNLERLVDEIEVNAGQPDGGQDAVERIRSAAAVRIEASDLFRVSYAHRFPQTAQQVTEALSALYIEASGSGQQEFPGSTQVIDAQLSDAKQRLVDQEKRIDDYRRGRAGQIAGNVDSVLRSIQTVQRQMEAAGEAVARARGHRTDLERQRALVETRASDSDAGTERALTGSAGQPPLDSPDGQPHDGLSNQIRVLDAQIASGEAEQARLRKALAQQRARIDALSSGESELAALTREYASLQSAYTRLLEQREQPAAQTATQNAIRQPLRLVAPASLPQRPVNRRQRLSILGGGVFAGLLLGFAFVVTSALRDSRFRTEEDVAGALALPVLAAIPDMDGHRAAGGRSRFT